MTKITKYEQLTEDLKEARFAALLVAAEKPEDGGTCNFDEMMIKLERWNEEQTLQAAKAADLSAFKIRPGYYLFSVPVGSQGNCRTRQAEKMRDVMYEKGYKVSAWYQMD